MFYLPMIIVFFCGAILGSFALCMAMRWRTGTSLRDPSRCDNCRELLSWQDLIPLFSWAFLKGRCRQCKTPIPQIYVGIEILFGLLCVLLYLKYGFTFQGVLMGLLTINLVIMSLVDLREGLIPNALVGILGGLALLNSSPDPIMIAMILGGIGAVLHYGSFKTQGTPGLGWGDVKLMGASGLWLSLDQIPLFLIGAGMLGILTALIMGRRKVPLGPSLCAALWLCLYWS